MKERRDGERDERDLTPDGENAQVAERAARAPRGSTRRALLKLATSSDRNSSIPGTPRSTAYSRYALWTDSATSAGRASIERQDVLAEPDAEHRIRARPV